MSKYSPDQGNYPSIAHVFTVSIILCHCKIYFILLEGPAYSLT